MVAAANTTGRGADRQYVGRNQRCSLPDRFVIISMDYDESWCKGTGQQPDWERKVQRIRGEINKQQIRVLACFHALPHLEDQ